MEKSKNPTVLVASIGLMPYQRKRSVGDVVYAPRVRQAGEALSADNSLWDQPVYTPPVDAFIRPGANDHLKYRSKGH